MLSQTLDDIGQILMQEPLAVRAVRRSAQLLQ